LAEFLALRRNTCVLLAALLLKLPVFRDVFLALNQLLSALERATHLVEQARPAKRIDGGDHVARFHQLHHLVGFRRREADVRDGGRKLL
jgi:hypothetical protein